MQQNNNQIQNSEQIQTQFLDVNFEIPETYAQQQDVCEDNFEVQPQMTVKREYPNTKESLSFEEVKTTNFQSCEEVSKLYHQFNQKYVRHVYVDACKEKNMQLGLNGELVLPVLFQKKEDGTLQYKTQKNPSIWAEVKTPDARQRVTTPYVAYEVKEVQKNSQKKNRVTIRRGYNRKVFSDEVFNTFEFWQQCDQKAMETLCIDYNFFAALCELLQSVCNLHYKPKPRNFLFPLAQVTFIQTVAPRNILSCAQHLLNCSQLVHILSTMITCAQSNPYLQNGLARAVKLMMSQFYGQIQMVEDFNPNDRRKQYLKNGAKFRQSHFKLQDGHMCHSIFRKNRQVNGFNCMNDIMGYLDSVVDRIIQGHPHGGPIIHETMICHPQLCADYMQSVFSCLISQLGNLDIEFCAPQTLYFAGSYEEVDQEKVLAEYDYIPKDDPNKQKDKQCKQNYVNTFRQKVSKLAGEVSLGTIFITKPHEYKQLGGLEQTLLQIITQYEMYAVNVGQQSKKFDLESDEAAAFNKFVYNYRYGVVVTFKFPSVPDSRFNMCLNVKKLTVQQAKKSQQSAYNIWIRDVSEEKVLDIQDEDPCHMGYKTDREHLRKTLYKVQPDQYKWFKCSQYKKVSKPLMDSGLPKSFWLPNHILNEFDDMEKVLVLLFQRLLHLNETKINIPPIFHTLQIERVSLHVHVVKDLQIDQQWDLLPRYLKRIFTLGDKFKDCRFFASNWAANKFIKMYNEADTNIFNCYLNDRNQGQFTISKAILESYAQQKINDQVMNKALGQLENGVEISTTMSSGFLQPKLNKLLNEFNQFANRTNFDKSAFMHTVAEIYNFNLSKAQQKINLGIRQFMMLRTYQMNTPDELLEFLKEFVRFCVYKQSNYSIPLYMLPNQFGSFTDDGKIKLKANPSSMEVLTEPLLLQHADEFKICYPYKPFGDQVVQTRSILINSADMYFVFIYSVNQVILKYHSSKRIEYSLEDLSNLSKQYPQVLDNFLHFFGLQIAFQGNCELSEYQQSLLDEAADLTSSEDDNSMYETFGHNVYWHGRIIYSYRQAINLGVPQDEQARFYQIANELESLIQPESQIAENSNGLQRSEDQQIRTLINQGQQQQLQNIIQEGPKQYFTYFPTRAQAQIFIDEKKRQTPDAVYEIIENEPENGQPVNYSVGNPINNTPYIDYEKRNDCIEHANVYLPPLSSPYYQQVQQLQNTGVVFRDFQPPAYLF